MKEHLNLCVLGSATPEASSLDSGAPQGPVAEHSSPFLSLMVLPAEQGRV